MKGLSLPKLDMHRAKRNHALGMAALILLSVQGTSISSEEHTISDIKPDENVVFFNTSGWLDETQQHWQLPIHGWIYEPQDSSLRRSVFKKILKNKYRLTPTEKTDKNFTERVNLLIADNERGKEIVIDLAGNRYTLAESAHNGHFLSSINISVKAVEKHSVNGYLSFKAVTGGAEFREFTGSIKLVNPIGKSVISDIDDTVKISHVRNRTKLIEQTFLLDFEVAPGMSELYQKWSTENVSFHYVSSSPWQLYQPLDSFISKSKFPWATYSLKSIRFRDSSLLDLFKKGTETKPLAIKTILDRYPQRKFVLLGDSGEQDPEVYAEILRDRPDQISRIYIRNVSDESADNERFKSVFDGISADRWLLFDDPSNLSLP